MIPHWYGAPELEVKLSDEQLGVVALSLWPLLP